MSAERPTPSHAATAPPWLWPGVVGVACCGLAGPAHREAVTVALNEAATADPPDGVAERVAASPEAVSRLAAHLHGKARGVVDAVFSTGQPPARALETPLGPGMCWDVLFAGELARTGPRGEELAGNVRVAAVERLVELGGEAGLAADSVALSRPDCSAWHLWRQDDSSPGSPPRWLRLLACALWADLWRPGALFESARIAPAMPQLVRRSLAAVRHGRALRDADRGGLEYRALDGSVVARFVAPALNQKQLEAMRRGVEHLRGVLFEAVIRGLVRATFAQAVEGINPYTRLVYGRGFEGLAKAYRINSKDRAKLPSLFAAMAAYRGADRTLPPIVAAYWTTGATRGRPAELRIDVGEALAPGYASVVARRADRESGDPWLLPVLPLPVLAIPGARGNDYAALCDLQWELLALFRARAEEGRDRGGWLLSAADVGALVDRAGLSSKLAGAWREPWTQGEGAWLREVGGGRLALADGAAAELLSQGGDYTTTGRSRARKRKCR